MMFQRDPVPVDANATELKAYLERTLADAEVMINQIPDLVYAAYGSMAINVPRAFPALGAGWNPIATYDQQMTATPRNVSIDMPNGELAVELPGVYLLTLTLTFEHNSSNQGRLTNVRVFNVTDGSVLGTPFTVGTGRNAEATQVAVVGPLDIPPSAVGDALRVELGGGSSYTAVQLDSVIFGLSGVGEFRGGF